MRVRETDRQNDPELEVKNMKVKRYTALLLALSMLLSLLSGCGKKDGGKAENTPAPTKHPEYELTDNAVNKEETVYINIPTARSGRSA